MQQSRQSKDEKKGAGENIEKLIDNVKIEKGRKDRKKRYKRKQRGSANEGERETEQKYGRLV